MDQTLMVPSRLCLALFAVATFVAGARDAQAEDASSWVRDSHSALRLVAGSRTGSVLLGGVEIDLKPGWKTYWRTPGDSGMPPRFDFSRSTNVESVTPLFPEPRKFDDGAGGTSFGYHKNVVFPLRIVPKNPSEPVQLRASISYAVCQKLCVPAEAEAELGFTSAVSSSDNLVAAALNKVPKPASTSDTTPLALRSFKREGNRVIVDVAAASADGVDLFAEGPTPDWALPVPSRIASPDAGTLRYQFVLDGLPANTRPEGAQLKLTLVGPDGAFEYNIRLN
jgi:DsbC/DsbD-like thiol-disulfide interchange protein